MKISVKILVAFFVLAAMTGCSKEDTSPADNRAVVVTDHIREGFGKGAKIRLRAAGVPKYSALQTKAAISTGDNYSATVIGWETDGTVDYASQNAWVSGFFVPIKASPNPDAIEFSMTPVRYYNGSSSVLTYIRAISPQVDESKISAAGYVDLSGVIAANGSTDLMYAGGDLNGGDVSGSSNAPITKPIDFKHSLSQLQLMVAFHLTNYDDAYFGIDEHPYYVKSIQLTNCYLPAGISVATGDITPQGTAASGLKVTENFTAEDAADPSGVVYEENADDASAYTYTNYGAPFMVCPGQTSITLSVVIHNNDLNTDITKTATMNLSMGGEILAGKRHELHILIGKYQKIEIMGYIDVKDWVWNSEIVTDRIPLDF